MIYFDGEKIYDWKDIKNRVVLPFLNDLGFESKNLKFEENIKLILRKNKREPMKDYIMQTA